MKTLNDNEIALVSGGHMGVGSLFVPACAGATIFAVVAAAFVAYMALNS